jgi:hypothetical protein
VGKEASVADNLSSGMRVGVAWYRESEWEKLRQLAADPEKIEETYAEWTKVYEDGIRTLRASGQRCQSQDAHNGCGEVER